MWTNSTSRPFFLKKPSSCATQVPLMLLAKEVHATRAFICDQAPPGLEPNNAATAKIVAPSFIFYLVSPSSDFPL